MDKIIQLLTVIMFFQVLDKDGKVDHNKVYFDPEKFRQESKVFDELPLDFVRCELDPSE